MYAFREGERKICLKPTVYAESVPAGKRKEASIWLVPDDPVPCGCWWSWTGARDMQGPCDLHVKSTWPCASRGVCHAMSLFPAVQRLSMCWHVMPSGHTSSWLHIGCVKNCRRNKEMAKVCRVLPWSPDTSTLGLSYEPNHFRKTDGDWWWMNRFYMRTASVSLCRQNPDKGI